MAINMNAAASSEPNQLAPIQRASAAAQIGKATAGGAVTRNIVSKKRAPFSAETTSKSRIAMRPARDTTKTGRDHRPSRPRP